MLARSGEITDPCPVPRSLVITTPSTRTPALSHFRIRRMMRGSPIRCSRKRTSHSWLTSSKNDRIGVQYVVHLGAGETNRQHVQRIVLATLGPEPIREPEEVLLVNRV